MDNARQTGAVLEAHFQFMQWLFPAIARSQAFAKTSFQSQNDAALPAAISLQRGFIRRGDAGKLAPRSNLESSGLIRG
ncbi:MAG: hypothetical protein ACLPPF_19650 [Rhodomicrobium sp.]